MARGLFNTNSIRRTVEGLDWTEVARKTLEMAEEYMPGAAFIGNNGAVEYAETMGEVDGLLLCMAREIQDEDEGEADDLPFELGSWVAAVSPAASVIAAAAFQKAYAGS